MASLPTQEYIGKAGAAGPAQLVTEPVQTCIRAAAHALDSPQRAVRVKAVAQLPATSGAGHSTGCEA
jgi:hypothetical protein